MASSNHEPIEKSLLHDWVENETRALDVVASWETLCEVYNSLDFKDNIFLIQMCYFYTSGTRSTVPRR